MSTRHASFAAWLFAALLQVRTASAQPAAPAVTAQDSMITTQGAPDHLLLDARNPLARPVRLRVVSVEYVAPDDAVVALRHINLLVATRNATDTASLPPGFHDTVTVFFDSAGVSPNRDRYPFRVHVELAGRRLVLRVNVTRGTRHPWRS